MGTTGLAIGCAGIAAMHDMRGDTDRFGRVLQVAEIAVADSLAGAANLVMGEGDEGVPAALISGVRAGGIEPDSARHPATRGRRPVQMSGVAASKYVVLSGGIGGAKLVLGLSHVVPADNLTVIVNTGDDFEASRPEHLAGSRHAHVYAGR